MTFTSPDEYAQQLIDRIRALSAPMQPIPTGMQTLKGEALPVRAVVFAVYGTLFVSGSTDGPVPSSEDAEKAIREALTVCGLQPTRRAKKLAVTFQQFHQQALDKKKSEGFAFPEVTIESVWQQFAEHAIEEEWIPGEMQKVDCYRLAVEYAFRIRPVWPMPNLSEAIETLSRKKIPIGLISNSQFYTPLLFPAFLGKSPESLGIDPDFSIWSYKMGEAKPSPHLFQKLADRFTETEIPPAETLYIGHDMLNDIQPAHAAGFQTALFAGDQRSLQLHLANPTLAGIQPNHLLTDVSDLLELL